MRALVPKCTLAPWGSSLLAAGLGSSGHLEASSSRQLRPLCPQGKTGFLPVCGRAGQQLLLLQAAFLDPSLCPSPSGWPQHLVFCRTWQTVTISLGLKPPRSPVQRGPRPQEVPKYRRGKRVGARSGESGMEGRP